MLDFNYDGLLPFKISIFVMPGHISFHISFHHADIYFSNKVDNYNYALLYKLFLGGIGDDVVFIILVNFHMSIWLSAVRLAGEDGNF